MNTQELVKSLPQHSDLVESAEIDKWGWISIQLKTPLNKNEVFPTTTLKISLGCSPEEYDDDGYIPQPNRGKEFVERLVEYVRLKCQ